MREYDEDYRVETDLTVSEDTMFAAETYMKKNQHLFLTKVSKAKCRNGRTTLQPDSVIHRGITKKIVVMPLGEMTLDYDSFDVFVADQKSMCFV